MSNELGFLMISLTALVMGSSLLGGQHSVCYSQASSAVCIWWEPLSEGLSGVSSVHCVSLLYQALKMCMDKCLACRSAGPEHHGQKSDELLLSGSERPLMLRHSGPWCLQREVFGATVTHLNVRSVPCRVTKTHIR